MAPTWITAFLDFGPGTYDDGLAFWRAATGYDVSAPRGQAGEFATLLAGDGDDYLRVQRLGDGGDRVHLDLHVAEPRAAADAARGLGAVELADHGYVVMTSPGGFTFCFVPAHKEAQVPAPTAWPGTGHSSRLDQVCLDVPGDRFDAEVGFWEAVLGWERRSSSVSTDFVPLVRPSGHPLRLLLQRLGEPTGVVRAHGDWATTDRPAEIARHEALGARVIGGGAVWTVLQDPVGRVYCVTDRNPETGMLG